MKRLRIAVACLFSLLLSSCAVLDIKHGKEKAAGIPFYVKVGVCRHEVVWIEPISTLNLQSATDVGGKEVVVDFGTIHISRSKYANQNSCPVNKLKAAIESGFDPVLIWNTLIHNNCTYDPLAQDQPDKNDIVLVSNTNTLEPLVDYRQAYYFNAKHPLIGSAKVDAKLNADGTLSEGTAEVEEKTLQAFLDLVAAPFSAGTSTRVAAPKVPGAAATTYRLNVGSSAIMHTLYRYQWPVGDKTVTCTPQTPPEVTDGNYNRLRSLVTPETAAKGAKNTVKINGEVKLPDKK